MFREKILAELKRRGWTVYRLHKEASVAKTVVYSYLSGKRELSSDSLERICRCLELELVRNTLD